jgi:thiol-disulfide isomerase/thioredoxin
MKKKMLLVALCFLINACSFAKDKEFQFLNGQEVSYEEMSSPQESVLLFWTTWCPYCRKAIAAFDKDCETYKGVSLFLVNVGEDPSKVERFASDSSLQPCTKEKIVLDRQGTLAQKFSVVGIPTYIFLKDGKVVHKSFALSEKILQEAFGDE